MELLNVKVILQKWDVNYGQMVIKGKLIAQDEVLSGYSTYVFECLDEEVRKETKYLMCTRFPNWNTKPLKIGDEGFLQFEEREAGKDKWYDINTEKWYQFNYNMVQFINFIDMPKKSDNVYIM